MTGTHIASERERIKALAEEYRAQGYEVAIEPDSSRLPGFLSGYHPDLVVTRGGERAVVEVKSRRSLAAEAQARDLARLLEGQPGWRFELIVVNDSPGEPSTGSVAFDSERAHHALEEGRSLLKDGYVSPAMLSGWAALEAALRLLLSSEGIEPRSLAPAHLLKQAVEEGLINRNDYQQLRILMAGRNAIAHGYENPSVNSEAVSTLLEFTDQLLNEISSPESVEPAATRQHRDKQPR